VKELSITLRTGVTLTLDAESAEVSRNSLIPDGFNLRYVNDGTSILYLRTDLVDAVILRERQP
jgi:hypothetical protein